MMGPSEPPVVVAGRLTQAERAASPAKARARSNARRRLMELANMMLAVSPSMTSIAAATVATIAAREI